MSNNSIIYAVIPTFNRRKLLQECILSLLSQTYNIDKIIVIDSGSNDGTIEMLKEFNNNKIIIIKGSCEWWWAKCMNEGIKFALNNNADYVLAMNDDTSLGIETLNILLRTSKLYQGSIIGSIVYDKNNIEKKITNGYGAIFSKFRWIPKKIIINQNKDRIIYYTEGQSGRGVLFPIIIYSIVGFYDDLNFPQYADRDFSYRCLKSGVNQYLDSSAITYLDFETTQIGMQNGKLKLKQIPSLFLDIKGIYNLKNQFRFLRKHYLFWPFWFCIWFIIVLITILIKLIPGGTQLIRYRIPILLKKYKYV
jgi:GT2 family glycosyltransferase